MCKPAILMPCAPPLSPNPIPKGAPQFPLPLLPTHDVHQRAGHTRGVALITSGPPGNQLVFKDPRLHKRRLVPVLPGDETVKRASCGPEGDTCILERRVWFEEVVKREDLQLRQLHTRQPIHKGCRRPHDTPQRKRLAQEKKRLV
jgi:hypothetical protein